jgi:hypothetical protein
MARIITYSPEEQERLIRSAMPTASYRLGCLLFRKQKEILDLAIHRGITLGVQEYGDATFHLPLAQVENETWQELADGVFYQSVYHLKEKGVIK